MNTLVTQQIGRFQKAHSAGVGAEIGINGGAVARSLIARRLFLIARLSITRFFINGHAFRFIFKHKTVVKSTAALCTVSFERGERKQHTEVFV
jgi:hypothetical protein